MVTQAEFDELHQQYHLMAETVEVGSQILAALIWRYGAGDGDERILILDGPLSARSIFIEKKGEMYTLTSSVDEGNDG